MHSQKDLAKVYFTVQLQRDIYRISLYSTFREGHYKILIHSAVTNGHLQELPPQCSYKGRCSMGHFTVPSQRAIFIFFHGHPSTRKHIGQLTCVPYSQCHCCKALWHLWLVLMDAREQLDGLIENSMRAWQNFFQFHWYFSQFPLKTEVLLIICFYSLNEQQYGMRSKCQDAKNLPP